jgi:vancomycin resistance protein YoaR/nitrate reductase NapE component
MKRKAGQAPSRSAEVRNTALVPVRSSESNTPAPIRVEAARVPEHKSAPKSSGKSSSMSTKSASKSASKAAPKSGSQSAKNAAKRSKGKKKKGKTGLIVAIVIVAVLLLGAGGGYGYLYYTGYFKPHVEVTMADGSVSKLKAEDVYAELSVGANTFYPGTFINNIDVSGMTVEQATEAVNKGLENADSPVNVNYNLKLDGKVYPLDFSDAKFEYNTKEVVEEAFAQHRALDETDYQSIIDVFNYKEQLKNNPVNYETSYSVSIDGVSDKVHAILDPLIDKYSTVKDAEIGEFNPDTKEFTITPEETGMTIDIDGAIEKVNELFANKEYTGSVVVPSIVKEPEITTEKIKANFGLIGEHVTKASNNANRNNNLNQACKNINGTILKPGEEFSFNKVVGQRTTANGFKEATVILGGQYEQGLGGGVCQVSSTLYNAVLKSDLQVTKRSPHAWPSDYVLEGLDATVNWPDLDFKFKNNTDYQIIVVMWFESKDRTVHAQIYGKRLPDEQTIVLRSECVGSTAAGKTVYEEDKTMEVGKTKVVRQAHKGLTIKTYKIWQDKDGKEIKRDFITTTTYGSYGKKINVGTKKADGTYATIDKNTGEVIGSASPTPVPTKKADPTQGPTTAPKPTDPPAKPTDPPAKPTDPPAKPTDPPAKPTDPPAKPTDPPAKPTDPPSNNEGG